MYQEGKGVGMPKRQVEIFSAGCPVCNETVEVVRRLAGDSGHVVVLDMRDAAVAERARALRIRAVPAVVVDGTVAICCTIGPTESALRDAGVGQPL